MLIDILPLLYFHLNYGAIDIIVTPEGDYVLLEVNSSGEYSWKEQLFDGKIPKESAKVLMNKVPRNPPSPHRKK